MNQQPDNPPSDQVPERLIHLVQPIGIPDSVTGGSEPERATQEGGTPWMTRLAEVNKELWLILSMLIIAVAMNFLVTGHRVILSVYALPTMFSAYFYGRRHAILTALASISLVGFLAYTKPSLFTGMAVGSGTPHPWFDIAAWGGILILTAAAIGTLRERHVSRMSELRQTYHGLLLLLRQFVSKDQQTESHCYRVSIYAASIAAHMGLSPDRVEDVRAASLLHDIGKVGVTRQLLQKAARLSAEEHARAEGQEGQVSVQVQTTGGPLRRIIPIVLAHVDKLDSPDQGAVVDEDIPLEARIISVADVYDSLTSDHAYRKAMSPFEAKGIIVRCSGTEFDPKVVDGFQRAFKSGELEVREMSA